MNKEIVMFKAFAAAALVFVSSAHALTASSEEPIFRNAPILMDINAGLLVGGGDAMPGIDAAVRGRLNSDVDLPLFLGAETGLFFFSSAGTSGAVVPILATLSTEFGATRNVHPVVGISAGPTLATGGGFSTARFTLLVNPGIYVDLNRSMALNLLVRLGVMGSTFVALPQVGLIFAI